MAASAYCPVMRPTRQPERPRMKELAEYLELDQLERAPGRHVAVRAQDDAARYGKVNEGNYQVLPQPIVDGAIVIRSCDPAFPV